MGRPFFLQRGGLSVVVVVKSMHTAAVLLSVSVFFQFSIRIRLERHGSFSSSSSSFSTRGCGIHTFLLHNNTEHGLSTSLLSVSIVPFPLLLFYGTYIHVDIRYPSTSGNSRSSWKTWWICSGAVWLLFVVDVCVGGSAGVSCSVRRVEGLGVDILRVSRFTIIGIIAIIAIIAITT